MLLFSFLVISNYEIRAQTNNAELLVGAWSLDNINSFQTMDAKAKQSLDTIPNLKLVIENTYRGRILQFNNDGTYSITLIDGRSELGTWSLNTEGNMLTLLNSTGGSILQTVTVINPARMILTTPTIEGRGRPILSQTHYTKL